MTPVPKKGDLDAISARLRREEQRLRGRVVTLTLVAIAIALALIGITSRQVARSRAELALLQDSAAQLRQEVVGRLETLESARRAADSLYAQVRAYEAWVEQRNTRAADSIKQRAAQQFEAERITPRVYLHIVAEHQRSAARAVQRVLEDAGFVVPGIERVTAGPRRSELRFFSSAEADGADRIRGLVADAGPTLVVRDLSARYASSASIRPGHYEIWFGPEFGQQDQAERADGDRLALIDTHGSLFLR